MLDIDDIADVMAAAVKAATAPLLARLDAVELLLGESADFRERLAALEQRELPTAIKGDQGDPGEVDMAEVSEIVAQAVARAIDALPDPEPGAPGEVDMGEVVILVDSAVSRAVAALPTPEPGQPGKDGIGLANALIDRDGNLVLTMTDGTAKELGVVVGRDGENGGDGKDGEHFTLDDFDIEQTGERAFKFKFTRGDVCHAFEFAFPVVLDRGVYSAERAYEQGDAVTWGGSLWIAQQDTKSKPDTPDSGWRLAVKRGRDGKDAR